MRKRQVGAVGQLRCEEGLVDAYCQNPSCLAHGISMCLGYSLCNMYHQEPLDGSFSIPLLLFASSLSLTLCHFGRFITRHLLPKLKIRGGVSKRCEPWSGSGSGISGLSILQASLWNYLKYLPERLCPEIAVSTQVKTNISLQSLLRLTSTTCFSLRLATKPFRARTLASNG